VKVNRTSFPNESREVIFTTLNTILKLAMTLPHQDPLAVSAYSAFVMFPRMILRSLPPGCKGRFAAGEFAKFNEGMIAKLIAEAHDSQVKRIARRVHDITVPTVSFSQAARAATLGGCGAVGKACKIAFSYGTENNPIVAANFLGQTDTVNDAHARPSTPSIVQDCLCPDPDQGRYRCIYRHAKEVGSYEERMDVGAF
jgi:hypothetical protein